MRSFLAFGFALSSISLLAAPPSFSASLSPAERERLGLAGFSSEQLAALDAAVAAYHAGQPIASGKSATAAAPLAALPAQVAPASTPVIASKPATASRRTVETPAAAASSRTSGVDKERVTARVVGEFRGWSGGTISLDNGQVWRQVGAESNELPPRRDAVVEIYPSGNGYWRLRFDGAWITVRRLQ
jgi:hypothetical protein